MCGARSRDRLLRVRAAGARRSISTERPGAYNSSTQSMESGQPSKPASHDPNEPALARASPPRIGLTWLERVSATAMLGDADQRDLDDVRELARACADALAGDDRDAARTRMLAREVALQKIQLDMLTALIGVRLQAGDERCVLTIDRLATSAAKRLALLAAEHRASCALERRTIVAIQHAEVVNVEGTK